MCVWTEARYTKIYFYTVVLYVEVADHVATYWHKIRMMFDNEVTCIGSNNCRSYNNQVFSNTSRIQLSQVNNLKREDDEIEKSRKKKTT